MADSSRHRRWLPGLTKRRSQNGNDVMEVPDGRDPLVAYYSDLRRIANDDARSRRPLAN